MIYELDLKPIKRSTSSNKLKLDSKYKNQKLVIELYSPVPPPLPIPIDLEQNDIEIIITIVNYKNIELI